MKEGRGGTEAQLRHHCVYEVGAAAYRGADDSKRGERLEAHARAVDAEHFHDDDGHQEGEHGCNVWAGALQGWVDPAHEAHVGEGGPERL